MWVGENREQINADGIQIFLHMLFVYNYFTATSGGDQQENIAEYLP